MQDVISSAVLFHDIYRGPLIPESCTTVRYQADYFLPVHVCIDNYGLLTAISKTEPSPGSDASMTFHVKAAIPVRQPQHLPTHLDR